MVFVKLDTRKKITKKAKKVIPREYSTLGNNFLKNEFGHIIAPKIKSGSEVPLESRAFLKEFSYSYKINRNCKNHEPYPKAMCSACIPPSIHMKRQIYRHVDYAQMMNSPEIGNLIQHWFATGTQRVGFLYGYYAEDPTYELGVRAVVEALYEPPQQNDFNSSIILPDELASNVDSVAHKLGMQRIGYVFTTYNTDVFLTAEEVFGWLTLLTNRSCWLRNSKKCTRSSTQSECRCLSRFLWFSEETIKKEIK